MGEKPNLINKETQLLFTGGHQCQTQQYSGPRQTEVSFSCDPTASSESLSISSVSEPSTCHYSITITTAQACGDERFPTHISAESAGEISTEDWFMELTELFADPSVIDSVSTLSPSAAHRVDSRCTVYSLEARARNSKLNFVSFQLVVEKAVQSSSIEDQQSSISAVGHSKSIAAVPLYSARHPGRRVISEKELNLQFEKNRHEIRNSQQFNGQLAFLKLYA